MTQAEYLNQIEHHLRRLLEEVRLEFANLPSDLMTHRPPHPKRWSGLECLEHLNRTYSEAIPKLELAIHKSKARKLVHRPDELQQYNWSARRKLRQYALSNHSKYKSAKRLNPLGANLSADVVKSLIIQIEKMLRLIQQAREVDLNKTVIKTGFLSFFTYNLGNYLEALASHTERHLVQTRQILREFQ